jgi:hypothetical protein
MGGSLFDHEGSCCSGIDDFISGHIAHRVPGGTPAAQLGNRSRNTAAARNCGDDPVEYRELTFSVPIGILTCGADGGLRRHRDELAPQVGTLSAQVAAHVRGRLRCRTRTPCSMKAEWNPVIQVRFGDGARLNAHGIQNRQITGIAPLVVYGQQ